MTENLTFLSLFSGWFQNNLHLTVSALLAAAAVWISDLPAKLNPIILPVMASIKREQVNYLLYRFYLGVLNLIGN